MEEDVLVINRNVLEEIGVFQGICLNTEEYLKNIWSNHNAFFMKRSEAEGNPSYKQIIPYVIMSNKNMVLSYIRGATGDESRLIKKESIGFGGHINPIDRSDLQENSIKEIYFNALFREISEEIILNSKFTDRIVGLINDDSDEVGRVHLGIIHNWALENRMVSTREQDITQLEFKSIDELIESEERMESWSRICCSHLKHIL